MYKVIIVDDEEKIVKGLEQLLPWADCGCQVVATAANGEEALTLVHEHLPDILFTDIAMPGMDGLSLIAALRSEYPHMEIAILSGYPYFNYAQRAIRLGVTGYIIKPSRMAELEDVLRQMVANLDKRRQRFGPVDTADDEAGDEAAAETSEANNFIYQEALKYMQAHYDEPLSLTRVADAVYVSQWHLSKLISSCSGKNFNDLLNGIRIDAAKELLEDPALRIGTVGEAVGYSDQAHFSRTFKKHTGFSPLEYRNQL